MKTFILAASLVLSVLFSAKPAFAMIDAFPSFLNFGDTVVGRRSLSQSVTITNRGPEDVSYINIRPSCGLDFDVTSNSCYGPLRPYQTCYVSVSFSPYREGYQTCSIMISGPISSTSISASGRGVKRNFSARADVLAQYCGLLQIRSGAQDIFVLKSMAQEFHVVAATPAAARQLDNAAGSLVCITGQVDADDQLQASFVDITD